MHFYGSDGTNPPDHVMGSHAPKSQRGKYYYDDRQPSVLNTDDRRVIDAIGDAKKVCARIAIAGHGLVPDNNSTYKTGNCMPITDHDRRAVRGNGRRMPGEVPDPRPGRSCLISGCDLLSGGVTSGLDPTG